MTRSGSESCRSAYRAPRTFGPTELLRHASPLRLLLVAMAAVFALVAQSAPTPACADTTDGGRSVAPRFGLAHVDNMDLHVARRPERPPAPAEQLPAADIADRYRRAVATGSGWNRWSVYWDLADRGGTFEWDVVDAIVARDVAHGLRTLAVLQGNPPGVRHVTGAPASLGESIFLTEAGKGTDDPEKAASVNGGNQWARFVDAAVQRYRPGGTLATRRGWADGEGVTAWEIGNEPNLRFFWPGTPSDYARFLEVAYLVAKRRDPGCTVIHAGIANDANAEVWFGQFLDALKRRASVSPLPERHGFYFDKTAWHWYTVPTNLTVGRPKRIAALLADRGIPAKPVWVTEFGAPVWSEYPGPCWDPASPLRVTVPEHSGFVWQAVAEGLVEHVEVMVLFQLYDDCGNGRSSYDAFGLIRNHAANQCWDQPGHACWRFNRDQAGRPRPSYQAYGTVVRELTGASVARVTAPRAWQVVEFHRAPDTRVTVAWSKRRSTQVVQLPSGAPTAQLLNIDADGNVRKSTVSASNGAHLLRLPGTTNRNGPGGAPLVDGRPVMLIEHGVPMPTASGRRETTGGAGSSDGEPPFLALVRALPPSSSPIMELTLVAGDAASDLGWYQAFFTNAEPPYDVGDWTPIGTAMPWPERTKSGVVHVPFVGAPGATYTFAGRAADLAGNWTTLPSYGQASTFVLAPATGQSPAAADHVAAPLLEHGSRRSGRPPDDRFDPRYASQPAAE